MYRNHFNEFKSVVQEYSIVQGDVYNMDETGFRIGVGGSQWIITMEFKKPQLSPSETNRDFLHQWRLFQLMARSYFRS